MGLTSTNNILLLFPNRIDAAVLSGGDWPLPLTNLQNRYLADVARSNGLTEEKTQFDIALDQARAVRALILVANNFSLSGEWRVQGASDAAFTDIIYDSEVMDVWPRIFDTADLLWEDENYWSGRPLLEDIEGYTWSAILVLPALVIAQYWRVLINDEFNTDGYVQIGRVFISGQWQPTRNYDYGAGLAFETNTLVEQTRGGAESFDVQELPLGLFFRLLLCRILLKYPI